ncbi:MAG: methyltransferase domain-containing protein [Betaproteobacteria bacterium]|nr:methyltransferase domain-containing protein [Betaproteobacteria bacterium]MDE2152372.1 class I SAM-dependent methyltransferase [Betaproteobacteria bacterium]
MKVVNACVVCGSRNLSKRFGQFAPFVAHRIADYPMGTINIGGQTLHPPLFTNSMRCADCGFVFSQIRFEDDELQRLYQDYRGPEYTRVRNFFEPGYDKLNERIGSSPLEVRNRAAALMGFLQGLVDPRSRTSVLDYGGDMGQHIPQDFAHCRRFVFDISRVATVDGVSIVNDVNGLGVMDFVICSNVLEHVPFPARVIDDIKKVCGPDTVLFVDVPLEMNPAQDPPDQEIPAFFHEHVNYFTPRSINALLRYHGFSTLKTELFTIDMGWVTGHAIYVLARPNWFVSVTQNAPQQAAPKAAPEASAASAAAALLAGSPAR